MSADQAALAALTTFALHPLTMTGPAAAPPLDIAVIEGIVGPVLIAAGGRVWGHDSRP